jgi:PPM family protein phosphatase
MGTNESPWSSCLDYAALSDVGLRRANNQDSFIVALAADQADFNQHGHLFMVADGMGAHAAGELASKMATDIVSLVYSKLLDQSPPEAILSATLEANKQIHTRGQVSLDFRGMGTTATTLVLLPTGVLLAHVGDSRAYRLRGDQIDQLTFDHSLVWELRASKQWPESEMPDYVSKNIITRSLGPNPAVQVDLEGPHSIQPGDTFLLCSDGLSNQVKDDEIGMILSCLPPADAIQALIDIACLRGGPDNITGIVVRVLGPQRIDATKTDPSSQTIKSNAKPVHPLVWTILGMTSLAAAGLWVLGHRLLALASLAGATAAAITALVQRGGGDSRQPVMDNRCFGHSPYVSCDCRPNADLLARLAEIARQLRDAALSENWKVDWGDFNVRLAQAVASSQAGKPTNAAREYLLTITSIMSQLRRQRDASGESGVLG